MAMDNLSFQQENAIRYTARNVISEFADLPRKQKRDDKLKRKIINKHFAPLAGAISRTMFIHYISLESGVLESRREAE